MGEDNVAFNWKISPDDEVYEVLDDSSLLNGEPCKPWEDFVNMYSTRFNNKVYILKDVFSQNLDKLYGIDENLIPIHDIHKSISDIFNTMLNNILNEDDSSDKYFTLLELKTKNIPTKQAKILIDKELKRLEKNNYHVIKHSLRRNNMKPIKSSATVNEANIKRDAKRILEAVKELEKLNVSSMEGYKQFNNIQDAVQSILGEIGVAHTDLNQSRKPIKSADKHFKYDEYLGDIYDSDESNADYWSREEYNEMVETARGIFYPAVQEAANACRFTVSSDEAEYVAEKCVRCFFDNTSWDEAVNRPEEYYIDSSRKPIKSSYEYARQYGWDFVDWIAHGDMNFDFDSLSNERIDEMYDEFLDIKNQPLYDINSSKKPIKSSYNSWEDFYDKGCKLGLNDYMNALDELHDKYGGFKDAPKDKLSDLIQKIPDDSEERHHFIDDMYDYFDFSTILSSKKPLKSGYYDTNEHPEGGGTCDYCQIKIAPGDGYESDFESTREAARGALIKALGGNNPHMSQSQFERWLKQADEEIDEDYVDEMINDVISQVFRKDGYMCRDCLEQLLEEVANDWVKYNW